MKQKYRSRYEGMSSKFLIIRGFKVHQTLSTEAMIKRYTCNIKKQFFPFAYSYYKWLETKMLSFFQNKSINFYFDRLIWSYVQL